MTDTHTLDEIAELLALARRPLFITGAGISAASGLPTYRGTGGLYANGLNEEGLPYEDVLSGYMLRTRPELSLRLQTSARGVAREVGRHSLVRTSHGRRVSNAAVGREKPAHKADRSDQTRGNRGNSMPSVMKKLFHPKFPGKRWLIEVPSYFFAANHVNSCQDLQ